MGQKKRAAKLAAHLIANPPITTEQFLAMLPADDPRRPRTPKGLLVMEGRIGVYYERATKGSVWGQWRYLRQVPEERVTVDVPNPIRSAEPVDPTLSGRNRPAAFGVTSLA